MSSRRRLAAVLLALAAALLCGGLGVWQLQRRVWKLALIGRSKSEPPGRVELTGLLRVSEPGGAFLRDNDPPADRWTSRDVGAIAAARGLADVAPYFVDADRGAEGEMPIGGLTVIGFRNPHLGYAVTWFVLAAMATAGGVLAWREGRRLAPPPAGESGSS